MATPPVLRTGCDLVEVAEVERSIARMGDRYLRRVFTAAEIAETAGPERARRLAARFAAKEAVVKALRIGDDLGPWTGIEVTRSPAGGMEVTFRGVMEGHRTVASITSIDVSVAHEGHLAMATAVVMLGPGAAESRPGR